MTGFDSKAVSTAAHAASHQNAGGDEISVAGLSGELADDQNPKAHASDHAVSGGRHGIPCRPER